MGFIEKEKIVVGQRLGFNDFNFQLDGDVGKIINKNQRGSFRAKHVREQVSIRSIDKKG